MDGPATWRDGLRADARDSAARGRWGVALMLVGWAHLAAFLACQAIYDPKVASDARHAAFWAADVGATLLALRVMAGPGWWHRSAAANLIVRIWGTFFLLCLNSVTLNALTGWDQHWYKLNFATLSSFGFATMAWIFDLRFLAFAFQMYFTGLLMVRFPRFGYMIYGVSWWAALQAVGWKLAHRNRVV